MRPELGGEAWASGAARGGRLLAPGIVGRKPALARIAAHLEGTPGCPVLALVGEAGIGKTRLARAAEAAARRRGMRVLVARANPVDAALPLGALRSAVRGFRRENPAAPAPEDPLAAAFPGWLLPEIGGGHGGGPGGSGPGGPADRGEEEEAGELDVVFEAATRWLWALAEEAGLLLVIEDVQHAAPSTCALMHHLSRTLTDGRLAVLLTYRPEDGGGPLRGLRYALARDRTGEEVRLGPLDADEVAEMVESILGAPADPPAREAIWAGSGGNPFFVEEVVRAAVDAGSLDPGTGAWSGTARAGVPWTVRETLLGRARALGEGGRDLLRWCAVAGERFDPRVVAAAAGVGEDAALAALEHLRDVGLVVDEAGEAGGSSPSGMRSPARPC